MLVVKNQTDCSKAPSGRHLKCSEQLWWVHEPRRSYEMHVYRSSSKDCGNCPLRSQCIGTSDFKKIDDSIYKPHYDKMHERLKTKYAKQMKKLRSSTVEPVLGTLINFTGMRRIWTRGIKAANKFMLGAAIAYNLKKYMKFITKQVKTNAMAMKVEKQVQKTNETLCFLIFCFRENLWSTTLLKS
jgi:hypothetical protein